MLNIVDMINNRLCMALCSFVCILICFLLRDRAYLSAVKEDASTKKGMSLGDVSMIAGAVAVAAVAALVVVRKSKKATPEDCATDALQPAVATL